MPRPHFTPGKDPVLIVQEAGWAPGPVWTGGKSRPHRDSIAYRPARSQSLYQLSYPAHCNNMYVIKKMKVYGTIILPVVLCGCETWSLTVREERRLRVFENMLLRRIIGTKRDEVTGEWRTPYNEVMICSVH